MSDTEETFTLLNETSNKRLPKHDDLESATELANGTSQIVHHKRKSQTKTPKYIKNDWTRLYRKALYMCPSKWVIILVIGLVVLLYLFTSSSRVAFLDQHRFAQPPRYSEKSLDERYESAFNERVMAPLQSLLRRLNGKIDALDSGDLPSILPVRVQLNDSQTMALIEQERSNMAALYYDRWKRTGFGANAVKYAGVQYCSQTNMVSPHAVKSNNLFWQVAQADDLTVYLYNAYYDNRLWGQPQVKIIAVSSKQMDVEKRKWHCLLWFDDLADPVLVTASEVYTVWPEYWDFGVKDGIFGPQIITCPIASEYAKQVPQAISLQSTGECNKVEKYPTNVLRVIYNKREAAQTESGVARKSIGICVQAFRFATYDNSVRLVEWLEMVKLMGADKVYFYIYGVSADMMKVLRHYTREGLVDWRNLTLPGEQPNVNAMYNYYYSQLGGKFWPQELIELNDCLYRNIHRHDYVAIFDIDEMPMPQRHANWHELIAHIEDNLSESDRKKKGYYLNRHAYVYEMFEQAKTDDGTPIPDWLYMMRHTYRAELFGAGSNIKCFHRSDLVTAVHNHFPMRCINTTGHHSCDGLTIDPKLSILMHYRRNRSPPEDCKTPETPINCTIHDATAWRFFDEDGAMKRKRNESEPIVSIKLFETNCNNPIGVNASRLPTGAAVCNSGNWPISRT